MTSILAFERANDTLRPGGLGSDAHGWRNALNAYGWSQDALTDPATMVFEDRSYRTFSGAVRAAVKAIARRGMPVGDPGLGRRARAGHDRLRGDGCGSARV